MFEGGVWAGFAERFATIRPLSSIRCAHFAQTCSELGSAEHPTTQRIVNLTLLVGTANTRIETLLHPFGPCETWISEQMEYGVQLPKISSDNLNVRCGQKHSVLERHDALSLGQRYVHTYL